MAQYITDIVHALTNCMGCFPGTPTLKINNRSFKIARLLGEGGFSYVYLVQDTSNEALYALKKIRCPFGQESVSLALREVKAYALFSPHPNIIQSIDHCVSSDKSDPGAKTVYIVLPYYRRGNLQDLINSNLVNNTSFPEKQLMKLFLGNRNNIGKKQKKAKKQTGHNNQGTPVKSDQIRENEEAGDVGSESEQQGLLTDREINSQQIGPSDISAYAHRDIKPGNIMIDDDGEQSILMDLGSLAPSPTSITSRSEALALQDIAAEHSTMPYRAPELFDVKTGSVIDTKVDIWSLGCTLYACLVGKSPFEMRSDETGGSLSICVLSGDWRFPDEGAGRPKAKNQPNQGDSNGISENIRELVRKCLKVEPSERPDVNELIDIIEEIIAKQTGNGAS
ncbi:serine/threonine protein kinase [Blumeria hordei DH14]|uniref:non-specific serine/threonine protein kinase n=1 Tax=Blumeria graminis f. sp. hordei (strain DH14) TaxID=546991 RepID=N1JBK8_BLUG1|nr:serine/threonine protein kinase [Blumeria hordei DH14]